MPSNKSIGKAQNGSWATSRTCFGFSKRKWKWVGLEPIAPNPCRVCIEPPSWLLRSRHCSNALRLQNSVFTRPGLTLFFYRLRLSRYWKLNEQTSAEPPPCLGVLRAKVCRMACNVAGDDHCQPPSKCHHGNNTWSACAHGGTCWVGIVSKL